MESSFRQLSLVFSSRRDLQTAASAPNWFQARCSSQTLRRHQPALPLSLSASLAPLPARGEITQLHVSSLTWPDESRALFASYSFDTAGVWSCLTDLDHVIREELEHNCATPGRHWHKVECLISNYFFPSAVLTCLAHCSNVSILNLISTICFWMVSHGRSEDFPVPQAAAWFTVNETRVLTLHQHLPD